MLKFEQVAPQVVAIAAAVLLSFASFAQTVNVQSDAAHPAAQEMVA